MNYCTGEIIIWGGIRLPDNFLLCNGSTVSISQYQTLYSLIGTTYGGDGVTTFGLPNLQSNVPVGAGTAATGTVYPLGSSGGSTGVALTDASIPSHTHPFAATSAAANSTTPNVTATLGTTANNYYTYQKVPGSITPTNLVMDPTSISSEGGNATHNNMQPFFTLNYVICVNGVYPNFNN